MKIITIKGQENVQNKIVIHRDAYVTHGNNKR